jgi:hypothetical protein
MTHSEHGSAATIDRDPGDCWTSINNGCVNDNRLPLAAKGLLSWLLSLPVKLASPPVPRDGDARHR